MTLGEWLASDQGQKFILALIGALVALATYFRSRATGKRVETVHHLVNGQATRRDARIAQLEQHITETGGVIPPTPLPELPSDAAELPIIAPPPPRKEL